MPSIQFTPQHQAHHDDEALHMSLSHYYPEANDRKRSSMESFGEDQSETTLDISRAASRKNSIELRLNVPVDHQRLERSNSNKRSVSFEEEKESSPSHLLSKGIHDSISEDITRAETADSDCNTLEDKSNTKRIMSKKQWIMVDVFCLVIFFLGGFIIFYFSSNANKDSSNLFQRTSSDQSNMFLYAPSINNVAQLCKRRFITTYNGFSICEDACEVAKCCFPHNEGSKNETCINEYGNNITCTWYYDPCKPIFNASIDQSNRTSLEDICSEENLSQESTKMKCYEACSPARCCFINNNTCTGNSDSENWCKMFSICPNIFNFDAMN